MVDGNEPLEGDGVAEGEAGAVGFGFAFGWGQREEAGGEAGFLVLRRGGGAGGEDKEEGEENKGKETCWSIER